MYTVYTISLITLRLSDWEPLIYIIYMELRLTVKLNILHIG